MQDAERAAVGETCGTQTLLLGQGQHRGFRHGWDVYQFGGIPVEHYGAVRFERFVVFADPNGEEVLAAQECSARHAAYLIPDDDLLQVRIAVECIIGDLLGLFGDLELLVLESGRVCDERLPVVDASLQEGVFSAFLEDEPLQGGAAPEGALLYVPDSGMKDQFDYVGPSSVFRSDLLRVPGDGDRPDLHSCRCFNAHMISSEWVSSAYAGTLRLMFNYTGLDRQLNW